MWRGVESCWDLLNYVGSCLECQRFEKCFTTMGLEQRQQPNITQHPSTSLNIPQHHSTSLNITQHPSTSLNITQHPSTSLNITQHPSTSLIIPKHHKVIAQHHTKFFNMTQYHSTLLNFILRLASLSPSFKATAHV